MVLVSPVVEIFQTSSIGDVITELLIIVAPLWIIVLAGVLVGWSWKPRWANLNGDKDSTPQTALSFSFFFQHLSGSISSLTSLKLQLPPFISSGISDNYSINKENSSSILANGYSLSNTEKLIIVDEHDLRHICWLTEETDRGPAWIQMMNRSTNTMSYQAWHRDPEIGPLQYRSRTVFENATPEIVRNFSGMTNLC